MFIEVVTLLRFEIPGGIGELETTNLLTGGNGDHREEPEPRNLLDCFLPPWSGACNWPRDFLPPRHRELGRDSRDGRDKCLFTEVF